VERTLMYQHRVMRFFLSSPPRETTKNVKNHTLKFNVWFLK
jgi:hypothetical protein